MNIGLGTYRIRSGNSCSDVDETEDNSNDVDDLLMLCAAVVVSNAAQVGSNWSTS